MKILYLVIAFSIFSCSQKTRPQSEQAETFMDENTLSFLALGDSYTIGESVDSNQRWPVLLANALNEQDFSVGEPTILATTGWTTNELQDAIDTTIFKKQYSLVGLLIGVNNQYRGYDIAQFEQEFEELLQFSIQKADKNRVFVVSIPDWGQMPFAEGRDRETIAKEIDQYNQVKQKICNRYDVPFINITGISRDLEQHPEYIADDGLHPSGEQYQKWVEKIIPVVKRTLK